MTVVHVIHSPISGIGLQGIDEIDLGGAKLFRNPAALAFPEGDLEGQLEFMPNVRVPLDAPVKAPPAPYDAELRMFGIARYLLRVEVEMPTNTITSERQKEELEWAVLPLRLIAPALVLTGNSLYFRGGCVSSGLADGGGKESIRREGLYATAPILYYQIAIGEPIYTIPAEVSQAVTEFALTVKKHRETLKKQLGVAIDTFSNSFELPSLTQKCVYLLISLENLFSEKGSRKNIRGKVVSRTIRFLGEAKDRDARRSLQEVVDAAFERRKDIEHGSLANGTATEQFFAARVGVLHDAVRLCLLRAVVRLNAGENLADFLPGLTTSKTTKRRARGQKA